MEYSVSAAAITCMWIVLILCAALVIIPAVIIRKKFKADWVSFLTGAFIFAFFAIGLENAPKQMFVALLMSAPDPKIWLAVLVSALMAGIFEESGRFFAFSVLLKKRRSNDGNSLMFGAGHGSCEVVLIVMFTMINNLVYSNALNAGTAGTMLASMDESQASVLRTTFEQLSSAEPGMFLVSVVERIAAVAAHIAFSVLVWTACKKPGKKWLYPVAVLLHTLLDFVPGLFSVAGTSTFVVEAAVYLCAALCSAAAIYVWKHIVVPDGNQ